MTIRATWTAFAAAALLAAQTASPPLTFEVATIKPSTGDAHGIMLQLLPGGGMRTMGTTLKMLITQAYDVRDFQVSGGPSWINTDRFDVTAKPPGSGGDAKDPREMSDSERKTMQEQLRARLQALLADRFQLAIRHETKEQPVYALVVAKGGPKIKPAAEIAVTMPNEPAPNQGMARAGGLNEAAPKGAMPKGAMPKGMMRMGMGELTGRGVELQMLITTLANPLGRPVLDHTGLTGRFDFDLKWTPDPGQSMGPAGAPLGMEPPPSDSNGPSLFTAIQEQLGLRLESTKGPVDTLVIDRVEKPSEN